MSRPRRRTDNTGRTTGRYAGQHGKRLGPPKDEGNWIWLTRDLLESDALQSLSLNAHKILIRLMIDHLSHAGTENGRLMATYDQLVSYGIRRSSIKDAIEELVYAGLVDVITLGGRHIASTYALTWIARADGTPPTNRWKTFKMPIVVRRVPPQHRVVKNNSELSSNIDGTGLVTSTGPINPRLVTSTGPIPSNTNGTTSISTPLADGSSGAAAGVSLLPSAGDCNSSAASATG